DKAGIILLIATQYRDYAFVTPTGYGTYAFTDAGRDYMEKFFLPHLRNDDYYKAFMAFADAADDFLARAEEKRPYDIGNIPRMTDAQRNSARIWAIVVSFVAGLSVALIVTGAWTAQLRSVRKQDLAHSYIRQGSMNLRVKEDVFLHKNVSMTARPKDSDSSGGGGGGSSSSGSFSSSSGGSYSGSSGKY
ncbi:MAG: TPM domain-containing protein, partial [Oscillospiraceae bacterium]|nr:TPM domain-containing protein [Oscillospiraceae bacterium]